MTDAPPIKAGLMNIGEEAKPRFAVLPTPRAVFEARAVRLDVLSKGHALAGFLSLIARICRAQSDIQPLLPAIAGLDREARTIGHGMPAIELSRVPLDGAAEQTLLALARALTTVEAPAAFKQTVERLQAISPAARAALLDDALNNAGPADDMAAQIIACAALQVHLTRLAATLDADKIEPVADGACPVCGSPPVASAVVSWPSAANTRFCTCSLCATQWHVVRLKCVSCGKTSGVSYPHIEGHPEGLRAETCDDCKSYVKIVYQTKDPFLEPFADDIASLDLDLVLKREGWTRGGRNPFLVGY